MMTKMNEKVWVVIMTLEQGEKYTLTIFNNEKAARLMADTCLKSHPLKPVAVECREVPVYGQYFVKIGSKTE